MAALAKLRAEGRAHIFVADMRALPALDPFDLITCLDDAVCHLLSAQDVLAALHGIRRNLGPGGLAVFDVALPRAYAEAADAIAGDDRHVVLWRAPEARGAEVDVRVDVFTARPDGLYERARLHQRHRRHRVDVLRALAARAGLTVLAVHGQQAGGVLCPDLDEARHRKALFVLTRRREEGSPCCSARSRSQPSSSASRSAGPPSARVIAERPAAEPSTLPCPECAPTTITPGRSSSKTGSRDGVYAIRPPSGA